MTKSRGPKGSLAPSDSSKLINFVSVQVICLIVLESVINSHILVSLVITASTLNIIGNDLFRYSKSR